MPRSMISRYSIWLFSIIMTITGAAFAQFTASIQGEVKDQSGAGVAKASVQIVNTATAATAVATSDDAGNYRFVSLAPGQYKITVQAAGFAKSEADVTLLTEQNLNVPISLKVGSISESVMVTTQAPIVDTADSRTQLTIENRSSGAVADHWPQSRHASDNGAGSLRLGNKHLWKPCIGRGQLLHRRAG